MKIFSNLSGTTSDNFKVGKRGFEIIRGYGVPCEEAPIGSMFVSMDTGLVYHRTLHGWYPVVTHDALHRAVNENSADTMPTLLSVITIFLLGLLGFAGVLWLILGRQ